MKSQFQRKLLNDASIREAFKDFLEEELSTEFVQISKYVEVEKIYRSQGRIEMLNRLKRLSDGS